MGWWIWILVGLGLLAVEVIVPGGIILLFFGAAAIVVGAFVWLGIGGPVWFQWAMFSVLSVASLLTLRGPILRKIKAADEEAEYVDSLVGMAVVASEDIVPGAKGKAELRGTSWGAQNVGTEPLARGEDGVVERVDGLKLYIRRI
jgi:membrane protein implicated in regulation of membrane protease activity